VNIREGSPTVRPAMPLIMQAGSIPRGDAIAENTADVSNTCAPVAEVSQELAKPACKPRAPYKPNQVKRDIRSLERFIAGAALLALKTLDQPNVHPVLVSMAASDLAAFRDAYAKHAAPHGPD
jgi:hypothetical protein